MRLKKKGSFDDVIFLTILIFITGVTTLVGWIFLSKMNEAVQAQSTSSTTQKDIMTNASGKYVVVFDRIFLVILIGLTLAIIFLASQIDTSPIMFPLTVIVAIILVIVCAIFGNSYYALASSPMISDYADDFVIIPFVFNHLVQMVLVIIFLVAGVMYARTQTQ